MRDPPGSTDVTQWNERKAEWASSQDTQESPRERTPPRVILTYCLDLLSYCFDSWARLWNSPFCCPRSNNGCTVTFLFLQSVSTIMSSSLLHNSMTVASRNQHDITHELVKTFTLDLVAYALWENFTHTFFLFFHVAFSFHIQCVITLSLVFGLFVGTPCVCLAS